MSHSRPTAWAAGAILAIAFATSRPLVAQEPLSSIIKQIQPSIVSILTYAEDGRPLAQGSGFAAYANAYANGLLVTNRRVMRGAYRATAKFADGEEEEAVAVRVSENDAVDLVAVELASRRVPRGLILSPRIPEAGERVVVIGSPLGLDQSVSDGIVAAVRQVDGLQQIQITAPISHGSSGSPVLNLRGEVLGVATSMLRDGQNLSFAIPSENILPLGTGKKYLLREYADSYVDSIFSLGTKAFLAGDPTDCTPAIPYLEQALEIKPSHVKSWLIFGQRARLMELNDRRNWQKWQDEAVHAFKQVIRYAPDEPEGYRGLGDVLCVGKPYDAVLAHRKLIGLKPDDVEAHKGLARAYGWSKQYAASVDEYKWVLERNADVDVLISLAHVYQEAEMKKEALASFQRAVRLKPDYPLARFMLGNFYALLKKRKLAMDELRILRSMDPKLANDLAQAISILSP